MKKLKFYMAFALLLALPAVCFGASEPNIPRDEFGTQPISIEVDGAPLKEVLKIFSQQSGLSFIASQEVENKRVTVFLESVPAGDALEGILTANNLRYERKKGGVFVVYPTAEAQGAQGASAAAPVVPMETKIFHIKYTRISISPMDVGGKSVIDDLPSAAEVNAVKKDEKKDEGKTSAEKEEKSNLMKERGIDKIVSSLLSENGHVAVDISTNDLIVTDTAQKLLEIEKVISRIDVPPSQIMIEVQMMEVKKDLLGDYGVSWAGQNGELASFTPGSFTSRFPFNEDIANKYGGYRIVNIDHPELGAGTLTLGTLDATNFSAALHFLTSDTHTKILARPRVLTLNNEAANINLVTKTVVGTKNTLVTSQSLTTFTTNEAVSADTGITLRMTPQINDDDTISLFLQPSITTVAASNFFPTQFLEPTTRTVRTMVRVKDNHTLVIGGLIDDSNVTSNRKIPLLGDLPVVGYAFNYKHRSQNDREFLIFITPHIMKKYDSLSKDSATAIGRDLAINRMLDQLSDEELKKSLEPLQNLEQDAEKENVQNVPEEIIIPPVKSKTRSCCGPTAEIDKEMTHTLDTLGQQKPKA